MYDMGYEIDVRIINALLQYMPSLSLEFILTSCSRDSELDVQIRKSPKIKIPEHLNKSLQKVEFWYGCLETDKFKRVRI